MELTNIRELVEKYWSGETSLEEEAQLRDYLNQEEAPADLKKEATLFRYYQSNTRFRTLDEKFDEQLMQRIEQKPAKQVWLVYRPWLQGAAAAVFVLVTGLFLVTKWNTSVDNPTAETTAVIAEDTYEDPRLAYEQTKEALLLVSSLMNEGTQHIEKLETFSEAQETVKTQIP